MALLLPWGESPGNEASWQAALGEAAHGHFVFGQDIVYTYGSLRHLAVNAALPTTYAIKTLAAVIIAALFATALIARVLPEGKLSPL